jgi:predicted dehydrogenase
MSAKPLRVGIVGAGYWSKYQLAAWGEISDAKVVAVCDKDRAKAEALGVKKVHGDAAEMLGREKLDVVDIISSPASHAALVKMAAAKKVPVICQKPMGMSAAECEELVALCTSQGVPFSVHENWRWQATLRAVKKVLASGFIGRPYRCRIDMITGFDVFGNQPGLKQEQRFIIADLGCHLLDLARSWFGEAENLYCQTGKIHADIQGEDVATIQLGMRGVAVTINMSYAGTPVERECFPETLVFIEADRGSLEVVPGFRIRVTTAKGTEEKHLPPPAYDWVDPKYAVVQSSMVACLENLVASLRKGVPAETDAADNLMTMRLVFGAYRSAMMGQAIQL